MLDLRTRVLDLREEADGQMEIRWVGWRLWMATPIGIVVFAAAYGITTLVKGDDDSDETGLPTSGITYAQGQGIKLGTSEQQVDRRLGVDPVKTAQKPTKPPQTCRTYALTDQLGTYEFCFADGKLVTATGTRSP
jgi:hypothetical protein